MILKWFYNLQYYFFFLQTSRLLISSDQFQNQIEALLWTKTWNNIPWWLCGVWTALLSYEMTWEDIASWNRERREEFDV